MEERAAHILEAVVKEFIRTGEPVSSAHLFERYSFGIKPAMIRFELTNLTDQGYLEQPHHSSGRVPQNSAYEFFATKALAHTRTSTFAGALESLLEDREWSAFLEKLSSELGVMAVIGDYAGRSVHKEGLELLLEKMEWGSKDAVLDVIRDCETVEERLRDATEMLGADDFLEVFIGRKSPLTRSDELAVLAGDYYAGDTKMYLFAIGPKRMDYERATAILKGLKTISRNKYHESR